MGSSADAGKDKDKKGAAKGKGVGKGVPTAAAGGDAAEDAPIPASRARPERRIPRAFASEELADAPCALLVSLFRVVSAMARHATADTFLWEAIHPQSAQRRVSRSHRIAWRWADRGPCPPLRRCGRVSSVQSSREVRGAAVRARRVAHGARG